MSISLPRAIALAAAFAAFTLLSCGEQENLDDLDNTWSTRDREVKRDLTDLAEKNGAIASDFYGVPSDPTNAPQQAERARLDSALQRHGARIGEVELRLDTLSSRRQELLEKGDRGDYEDGWKEAQGVYTEIAASITELEKEQDGLESQVAEFVQQMSPEEGAIEEARGEEGDLPPGDSAPPPPEEHDTATPDVR